jgi:TonB family protein
MRLFAPLCFCLFFVLIALSQQAKPGEQPSIGGAIAQKNLIVFVPPEYPPLAKSAAISGKVRAEIVVDQLGNVTSVQLLSGHPVLAAAGISAIRKWKYKPFEIDGKPTDIRTEVEVSIPADIDKDEQRREDKFQEAFWSNKRAGDDALKNNDLQLAKSKFEAARAAAEERGDSKWLSLCEVITSLGNISFKENDFAGAERLYKEALALHEKHQRPDEAEVAGAQQRLAFLYFQMGRLEDAEPLYRTSVETYEAHIKEIGLPEPEADYGRHLALGYFALSQIALSSQRGALAREECQKALSFAQRWSGSRDRKVIESTCGTMQSTN